MNVLHVTVNYPTKDHPIFGIFVKEQIESLQKKGIDCDVFYCDGEGKGLKKYLTYVPKLWWRLLTHHYDIVHCHHALSAIILSMTGWPLFTKCVLSYQNDPVNEWGDKMYRFFNITFNKFIIKNNSPYLRYKKFVYLPNGCNEDFFVPMDMSVCKQKLDWDLNRIYIMYMDSNKGNRTQKRIDRFEETLKLLNDKYGYDNIEPVIMRSVPREQIPTYMNACHLHLMSSDFEGSPNSVKECMCCNTPVVSTDVGNVKEMIGDIPGSYVIDDFSAETLAQAVDLVLKADKPFKGREMFLAKGYGMSVVADKLINVYKEILKIK